LAGWFAPSRQVCNLLALACTHHPSIQPLRAGLQTLGRGHADQLACVCSQARGPVPIAQGWVDPALGVCNPRSSPGARVWPGSPNTKCMYPSSYIFQSLKKIMVFLQWQ